MKGCFYFLRMLVFLGLTIVALVFIVLMFTTPDTSTVASTASVMCIKDSTDSLPDVWVFDVDAKKIVAISVGERVEILNKNSTDAIFQYGGKRYGAPLKNLERCE